MFFKRLLGQRVWTPVDWRAWSVEQAIAAGARGYAVVDQAEAIIAYVGQDHDDA